MKLLMLLLATVAVSCSGNKSGALDGGQHIEEEIIDFTNSKEYPSGVDLIAHKKWVSHSGGQLIKGSEKGVALSSEEDGKWNAVRYVEPYVISKEKEAITISTRFTYDQVSLKNEKEVLRIGLTNGESELLATFCRKGWGDYHSIGMKGYPYGVVFHTTDIGFENNKSVGTSDELQLAATFTRQKDDKWDLVVVMSNLSQGSGFKKVWQKKEVSFEKGTSDKLYVVIQNGASDTEAGIANRIISSLTISDEPAPEIKKDWNGVNFKDYVLPMKPQAPLVSAGTWGKKVFPRDTANGLEDTDLSDWCYWDGSIVKDDEGKYHMYASRWTQTAHHGPGWKVHSKGIHSVSDNVMGPYIDQGIVWPNWKEGRGSNVVGLRMFDKRYAVVTSEITKGEVFVSDNPDGPFELLGEIKVDLNGFDAGLARYDGGKGNMSNVMIIPRHDGRYMIVARSTAIMISEDGILGPYKIMSGRIYENMPEIPKARMEDPTAWYSGGMYHMLVNHWPGKTTYHFSSLDGIHDWKYRGIAYRKDEALFRYTDGTVDEWKIVQRPTAYTEGGHITHFNFSVIDVTKGADRGGDEHGSKVIIVPFDGESFDRDMQEVIKKETKP